MIRWIKDWWKTRQDCREIEDQTRRILLRQGEP